MIMYAIFKLEERNKFFVDFSDELAQDRVELIQHEINSWFYYADTVRSLAEKMNCYWLIDEIGLGLFRRIVKQYSDWLYAIKVSINADHSATIRVEDSQGKLYFTHHVPWTDSPSTEKPMRFYLLNHGTFYCLFIC
jgi:hypothetical protein